MSLSDKISIFAAYQPLVDLISVEAVAELERNPNEESIKNCYTKLMHSSQEAIDKCVTELTTTFKNDTSLLAKTFAHCNKYFPNDVGVLSIFFLNILELKPGQAMFLAANVPHAYLSGDCIECMACSDNVIRAGLTPKFKDVETLLEMLDYRGKTANETLFTPVDIGPYSKLFKPPVNDFAVVQISVPTGVQQYAVENRAYGSIIIVLEGSASASYKGQSLFELSEGSIVFVPACIKNIGLNISQNSTNGFVAYQAQYNDF